MMVPDFKEIYNSYREAVETKLSTIAKYTKPENLYFPIQYILEGGGKRLRPVLSMICCGAVGSDPMMCLDAAAAIEIMHNFTLVHDDIMDKSPIRRGKQTIHKKWNEPTAILTGDLMIGHSFRLLSSYIKLERFDIIYNAFINGLIEVCEGQGYDILFDALDNIKMNDYTLMIAKKTARLMEASAIIGASIGLGSETDVESLKNYAYSLGLAFQIQDDLLDLTASESELGKKIGQDIIDGKKTFLIIKAYEKAQSDLDIDLLKKFQKEKGLCEEYILQMKDMLVRLGVLENAQNEIEIHLKNARNNIGVLKPGIHTDMLHWILNTINKRSY